MKKLFLLMLLPLAMSIVSCEKDDELTDEGGGVTPNNPKDVSVTSSADVQSCHSVVLKGYANGANGKVGFCYSDTDQNPTPENSLYVETSTINSDQSYELTVDNLKPGTKYYYRAFATKDLMMVMAKEVKTFTTEEFKLEAVDLGLPSGTKWATCNVGAYAPEEYGDYFAWGETEGYNSGKTSFSWSTYKWCNGSSYTMTKYCTSLSYGTVDNKTVLESADDAATVNWGGSWRMPTTAEQDELLNRCTWTRTTQNGVNGLQVVGPNGNSIFLPAAGYRDYGSLDSVGSYGYYWSSSLSTGDSDDACSLYFYSGGVGFYFADDRFGGHSVRPVCVSSE